MYDIVGSIVAFKNDADTLKKAVASFLNSGLNTCLYVVDNSPTDALRDICDGKNVRYIFNNRNLGFSAAHNIAIRNSASISKYHLVLNPDIFFEGDILEKIFNFMEENKDIGLLMPKICYPDGSIQYLCKLLPRPLDLISRRFDWKILNSGFKKRLWDYELRFTGYDRIMDVPHLSGCFMFLRKDVFVKAGFFDERFFMYLEDIDLTRRIHRHYRTVYYPHALAYHSYAKGSYNNFRLFRRHVSSAIKYFNKWGWFFDSERESINKRILKKRINAS